MRSVIVIRITKFEILRKMIVAILYLKNFSLKF